MIRVICINGPSGVGKNTVSTELSMETGYIHFDEDLIYPRELVAQIGHICLNFGKSIILSGGFPPDNVIFYLNEFSRKNVEFRYFTLRARIKKCLERNSGKPTPYTEDHVRESYANAMGNNGTYPWIEIDAEGSEKEAVKQIILKL